jgi:hypothetical protein
MPEASLGYLHEQKNSVARHWATINYLNNHICLQIMGKSMDFPSGGEASGF